VTFQKLLKWSIPVCVVLGLNRLQLIFAIRITKLSLSQAYQLMLLETTKSAGVVKRRSMLQIVQTITGNVLTADLVYRV
jgi:hypothetical protein